MSSQKITTLATAAVLASIAMVAAAQPASAQVFDLPKGEACPDFGVRLESGEIPKELLRGKDPKGNKFTLFAGSAPGFTLTNADDPNQSLTVGSTGAAVQVTDNTDGSQTFVWSGHLLLILFPTDNPAGPSTTLIQGRAIFMQNGTGTVLQSINGNQTDLCAELAS